MVVVSHHQRALQKEVENAEQKERQALRKLKKAEDDVKDGWAMAEELERVAMIENECIKAWEEQLTKVQDMIEKQSIAQNELVVVRKELQEVMQQLEETTKKDNTTSFTQRLMESCVLNTIGGAGGFLFGSGSGGNSCDGGKPCGIMSASDNIADMIYPGPSAEEAPSYYDFDIDKEKLKKRNKQKKKQQQREQQGCRMIDGMAEMIYPSYGGYNNSSSRNNKQEEAKARSSRGQRQRRQLSYSSYDDDMRDDETDSSGDESDMSYDNERGINFGSRSKATRERHSASRNRAENFG